MAQLSTQAVPLDAQQYFADRSGSDLPLLSPGKTEAIWRS